MKYRSYYEERILKVKEENTQLKEIYISFYRNHFIQRILNDRRKKRENGKKKSRNFLTKLINYRQINRKYRRIQKK